MQRFWSLLDKELRQHWVAWLALLALQGLALLLLLMQSIGTSTGVSLMEAFGAQLMIFMPVAAMILGNRLVVAEYHGRTQLFVESLPIRRHEMVLVKYLLGWAVLSFGCLLALAVTAAVASTRESIDGPFVLLVACRSLGFIYCVWGFFFVMGFTGRLRIPIYLALLLALGLLDGITDLQLELFGPFALVDLSTLPFERYLWPWQALAESVGLGTVFLALALAISALWEGSLVESLSRRMSHREKAIIAVLFTGLLIAFSLYDERQEKEPYAFDLQEVVRSSHMPLEILYLRPQLEADAADLLRHLETELQSLNEWVRRPMPPLRVAYYPSLDGQTFDWATLADNDGLLVRANFEQPGLDRSALTAEVIREVLDEVSRGRADFESQAWAWDGFGAWWAWRAQSPAAKRCNIRWRHARWAVSQSEEDVGAVGELPNGDTLRTWWRFREARGPEAARSLATTGLWTLEEEVDEEAVLQLARALWEPQVPQNLRVLWTAKAFPQVFEETTGLTWEDFLDRWRQALQASASQTGCSAAERYPAQPPELPAASAALELETLDDGSRQVDYRVQFVAPPPEGTLVRLLHRRLGPFDRPLAVDTLQREEHLWPGGTAAAFELGGVYGSGSLVFLAVEVEPPEGEQWPRRLVAQRREVP